MEIFNHIKNDGHKTLFAFINTYVPIIVKELYYVEYTNGKGEMLLDDSKYLFDLYWKYRKNENILEYTDDLIKKISHTKRYYSFIKIIKDADADLIGKTMILFYGRSIKEKIEAHINENKRFDNLFCYIKSSSLAYPTYADSYFTDDKYQLNDFSLNMDDHIKYKTVILPYVLLRKDKLLKIKERICSKHS